MSKSSLSKILKSSLIISLLSISSITYSFAFEPIGRKADGTCDGAGFTGEFSGKSSDGVQHKIIGLDVNGGDYAALFGCTSNANIHDVVIESGNITGNGSVGGIVGYAGDNTIIKNNVIGNNVNIKGHWVYGSIVGNVGGNNVNIANNSSFANATGSNPDSSYAGGIVGFVNGLGSVVQNNLFYGVVSGNYIGGLVGGIGYNKNVDILNNIVYGRVNPVLNAGFHGLLVGEKQESNTELNLTYLNTNRVNFSNYCDKTYNGDWETIANMNWVGGWGRISLGDNDSVNGILTARYFSKDQITEARYPGLFWNINGIKYLKSGENLISTPFTREDNRLINSKGIGRNDEFSYINNKGAVVFEHGATGSTKPKVGGNYQESFLNTYQRFIPACDFQMTIKPVI